MFLKVRLTKCCKGCTGFVGISIVLHVFEGGTHQVPQGYSKMARNYLGIISELSGIIPELSRRGGAGAAARDHPSTRAGGQDDVSLNKLPQIISRCLNRCGLVRSLPTHECRRSHEMRLHHKQQSLSKERNNTAQSTNLNRVLVITSYLVIKHMLVGWREI